MPEINPFVNLEDLKISKYCSLYRAICYIAFKEIPYDEGISKLLYPERNYYLDACDDDSDSMWDIDEFMCGDDPNDGIFFNAAMAFLLKLKTGEHKIFMGHPLKSLKQNNRKDLRILFRYDEFESDYVTIPPAFWHDENLVVDFIFSEADSGFTDTYTPIVYPAYANIVVNTKKLMEIFPISPQAAKNDERRGRKLKYNWDAFHREIIRIANTPNGLPEIQAHLEKVMQEWCANNWPDEPGESTIREKISAIYQEINKARK